MITFKILAERIAQVEGKKKQVNIAQIREVLKATLCLLAYEYEFDPYDTVAFLKKYRERKGV